MTDQDNHDDPHNNDDRAEYDRVRQALRSTSHDLDPDFRDRAIAEAVATSRRPATTVVWSSTRRSTLIGIAAALIVFMAISFTVMSGSGRTRSDLAETATAASPSQAQQSDAQESEGSEQKAESGVASPPYDSSVRAVQPVDGFNLEKLGEFPSAQAALDALGAGGTSADGTMSADDTQEGTASLRAEQAPSVQVPDAQASTPESVIECSGRLGERGYLTKGWVVIADEPAVLASAPIDLDGAIIFNAATCNPTD